MKDVATPATQTEVRGTIKEALTKAALVNYERLSEEARIEGNFSFFIFFVSKTYSFFNFQHIVLCSLASHNPNTNRRNNMSHFLLSQLTGKITKVCKL